MHCHHESCRSHVDPVSILRFNSRRMLTRFLFRYMQYHIDKCLPEKGETYKLAKEFGQQLIDNCKEALKENPVYKDGE